MLNESNASNALANPDVSSVAVDEDDATPLI